MDNLTIGMIVVITVVLAIICGLLVFYKISRGTRLQNKLNEQCQELNADGTETTSSEGGDPVSGTRNKTQSRVMNESEDRVSDRCKYAFSMASEARLSFADEYLRETNSINLSMFEEIFNMNQYEQMATSLKSVGRSDGDVFELIEHILDVLYRTAVYKRVLNMLSKSMNDSNLMFENAQFGVHYDQLISDHNRKIKGIQSTFVEYISQFNAYKTTINTIYANIQTILQYSGAITQVDENEFKYEIKVKNGAHKTIHKDSEMNIIKYVIYDAHGAIFRTFTRSDVGGTQLTQPTTCP